MTENGPLVVADTNSSVGQLVVPPWAGTLVGAATGAYFIHSANQSLTSGIPAILGFAILGLFFSLCANRTTLLGYLLVGVFMGINCGILTSLVRLCHLDENWPLAVEHHTSWKHCFGFGEILALTAILFSFIQGSPEQKTLPKD